MKETRYVKRSSVSTACGLGIQRLSPPQPGVHPVRWSSSAAVLLLALCGIFGGNAQTCRAQSIFDAPLSPQLRAFAEDAAARFLANEAELPDRVAVMTSFNVANQGTLGNYRHSGTQFYIADTATGFRRIRSSGFTGQGAFEYESLWIDGQRWIYDEYERWYRVYKPGSKEANNGEPKEDKHGFAGSKRVGSFDPMSIWITPPWALDYSFYFKPADVLRPDSVQATRLNRDDSVSALFAQTSTRGVNRLTELTFPRRGMPVQFTCYSAMEGDYNAAEAKAEQKSPPQVCTVKWVEYDRDRFVPVETLVQSTENQNSTEAEFTHHWLLGSAVDDQFFQDPRKFNVRLESEDFQQPVTYRK
jgi:hypothetical protein